LTKFDFLKNNFRNTTILSGLPYLVIKGKNIFSFLHKESTQDNGGAEYGKTDT